MILTHTFNPSIDITYTVPELNVGDVHRVREMIKNPGGKGINVSKVLKQLGAPLHALLYSGGANGRWLTSKLADLDLSYTALQIEGETRQCIAINDGRAQTEILEAGPVVSQEAQQSYLDEMAAQLVQSSVEVMTISGSSPQLAHIDAETHLKRVLALSPHSYNILDTKPEDLVSALKAGLAVDCIKPNRDEFRQLLRLEQDKGSVDEADFEENNMCHIMTMHPLFKDIDVFLTLGAQGAIVKYQGQVYRATVPIIQAVNPVGSGDSTVAGIAYGIQHFSRQPERLIQHALACGMSNAMQQETGYINIKQVQELTTEINVEMI
ncbi:hexose kinase [Staphylococcus sp. SQ8-PEA]|uniref:Tagatose-6-phosphate kinase n=1 Tax=Staphylococcus marylandisciuri TaxID=2981529 RepID=A0ABT2QQR0_9STAP|nr:hexose kinase [Staphylococcus marylandisciuri]MCU5746316.1 hexose kinase [Staphylococcus marylandisciuri]